MSKIYTEKYDALLGFYKEFKEKTITYISLYKKIIDTEEKLIKEKENNSNFKITIENFEFNIIKMAMGYNVYANENEFFTTILKKISITNSETSNTYIVYNYDHISELLILEKLEESNISLYPIDTPIFNIFFNKIEKYTINNIKEKSLNNDIIKVNLFNTNKLKSFISHETNYVKYNDNSLYYDSDNRNYLINLLIQKNYTFLCGPSGSGKTVTLLYFRAMPYFNVLYFNLKYLSKFNNDTQIKQKIILELRYCFDTNVNLNNFIDEVFKVKEDIKLKSSIDIIQLYLINIIKNYQIIIDSNKTKKPVCVILDQYKYKFDPYCRLDNLLKSYNKNIHYIKCSSMNEENVKEEIKKYLFEENENIIFMKSLVSQQNILKEENLYENKEKNIYLMDLGYFPLYVENINSIDDNNKEKIEKYSQNIIDDLTSKINNIISKKANLYNIQPYKIIRDIIKKEGIDISRNEFERLLDYLPLKYVLPFKKNNNIYMFNYSFKLLGIVFKNIYNQMIENLSLDYYEILESGSKTGFLFEEIVQCLFKAGKNLFNNEKLIIKKEVHVNSIYNLNEVKFCSKSDDKNIIISKNNNLPVYQIQDYEEKKKIFRNEIYEGCVNSILQRPCGELYDCAVLIPTGGQREFDIFLCQITLDKEYNEFLQRSMIIESLQQIKKRFELIFDIKIRKFYFSYILDQNRKGRTKVEEYCNDFNNKLYCSYYNNKFLYNKKGSLFNLNNMKKNCLITELSEENVSYNLNTSLAYKTCMSNSSKISFSRTLNIEYITNEKDKKNIIEETNLLCELSQGKEIQTFLNKKRDETKKKKNLINEKDINNELSEKSEKNKSIIVKKHIEIKKNLKLEGKEIHKKINTLIEIFTPDENEAKIFKLNPKRKIFYLSEDYKQKICKLCNVIENSELKIIERGAFFPLNICGLENYIIIYYNKKDKNNILVKYNKNDSTFEYWDINEIDLLSDKDGFNFMNNLNNPKLFFENYSSYLIKIENITNKDENEEDICDFELDEENNNN